MYNMYPWNQPVGSSDESAAAAAAVQVALDRRDNGGDAGSLAGRDNGDDAGSLARRDNGRLVTT